MNGFFGGIIGGLVVAFLLTVGGAAPGRTLGVSVVVVGIVWGVTALIRRAIAQREVTGPRFRLLQHETVSWRTINGIRMSWCRLEATNDGTPGTVGIHLVRVEPKDMTVNGMGGLLRGMGRPTTENGNVALAHGQRQKFDLYWVGKREGSQYNVPRRYRVSGSGPMRDGPRRLLNYAVCLKDGANDAEPVEPKHCRYAFDVSVTGGPQPVNARYEVRVSAAGGVLIRQLP